MLVQLVFKGFQRIIVTGGAGFIGSHLAEALLKEGAEVIVLDDFSSGKQSNLEHSMKNENFTFYRGDIRDKEIISKLFKEVDVVFHEAAQINIKKSVEDPITTNDVNVNGTLNILKACVDNRVKRLIFASSCAVYGDSETLPIGEDTALKPISPYAASKLAAENYVRAFHRIYGLETVCLRYFNVYGPRQTLGPYSGVIPIFIDQLLKGEQLMIFGDGEQTRDFVNVKDIVEANVCALKTKAIGEVFNVATGQATSINELAQLLQKITGRTELKPKHAEPRTGDIDQSYADISKSEKLLGYKPKTSLQQGLTELVREYQKIP
ncbi:MAG: family oxidoreductase [Thermoproteota archaeon]|nr:family oxidoreductase [Thermoproteota archaeon]